jgi:hypothetical protein
VFAHWVGGRGSRGCPERFRPRRRCGKLWELLCPIGWAATTKG